ncbi:23S rRNA (pseudouridine(1915)-N(3))-methyltransferase RlmH [Helicobacter cetorum]|uniref:Ribosomal RNA large subunit methyltransferase H n=1 Tax=Helicobacter cetorum (strain ATCC BAA-540 / CCUG 52418 / MIT 99-5656) TaxID=1163745 RepID=I0ER60_HELCM|nr:23S rRNA (pseudouridine(1915)-N(3))-methyltransferase RlmH [Helicobacter cetorum]AFI05429.1 rRNA large subunit methyltransferase [Helicobacter cetorum MIT 99-5656]
MRCVVYSIAKNSPLELVSVYQKQCKQFACELELVDLFPKAIANAQKVSKELAQKSYSLAFEPYLNPKAQNIALHPKGRSGDSFVFSEMLQDNLNINFFIAGAFGFEEGFLKACKTWSLSEMTFSHEVAKIVLCEQVYRALSIIFKHPYHK